MITIKSFTFNPFQENMYILHDETKQCVIIDPGCYTASDEASITNYITENKLHPVRLTNTHCHIDHVFGVDFITKKYNLKFEIHKLDLPVLQAFPKTKQMYDLQGTEPPQPQNFLNEGDVVKFGNSQLEIVFTPGHSPGSITYYNKQEKFMIAGDVLFYGSIGRSDLPGGDHATLISSIKQKLFPLGDDFTVYSGHGPKTTIGFERKNNPFLS